MGPCIPWIGHAVATDRDLCIIEVAFLWVYVTDDPSVGYVAALC